MYKKERLRACVSARQCVFESEEKALRERGEKVAAVAFVDDVDDDDDDDDDDAVAPAALATQQAIGKHVVPDGRIDPCCTSYTRLQGETIMATQCQFALLPYQIHCAEQI